MLIKTKTLVGYKLDGLDGEIGKVKDLYFDDRHWTIRYLIAETGSWLTGRQVLISPFALVGVNKEERNISIDLVKKQIEKSPSLDSDKPVSRQFEEAYYGHYGYPVYWADPSVGGHILIQRVTPNNGRNPVKARKAGTCIYAAPAMQLAIISRP